MAPWAVVLLLLTTCLLSPVTPTKKNSPPDGYYLFDVAPFKTPPKVRKPPYLRTSRPCPGFGSAKDEMRLSENLCGDLQAGEIPSSPVSPSLLDAEPYPFDLIKNKSLEFFGSTLPILKGDPTLPKVARFQKQGKIKQQPSSESLFAKLGRGRRSAEPPGPGHLKVNGPAQLKVNGQGQMHMDGGEHDPARNGRGFCDTNWGVFCALFKGWSGTGDDAEDAFSERSDSDAPAASPADLPLTPCPSVVDYVTPVFARNYEGVWRYVVQIPHEGYFTQTVEVTNCVSSRCHLLEGACLTSPRWLSLLVAEMFYPHQTFPLPSAASVRRAPVAAPPPPSEAADPYVQNRAGEPAGEPELQGEEYCDGTDQLGCYQVRLYYDWFLVPGSCKCWKDDVFASYRAASRTPKSAGP